MRRFALGLLATLLWLWLAGAAHAASGPSERAGVSSPADQRVPGLVIGLVVAGALVLLAAAIGLVRRLHDPAPDRDAVAGEVAVPLPAQTAPAQSSALRVVAVAAIGVGFAVIAVGAAVQVIHLIWRPAEIGRMLGAAASLAVDFPGRFTVLMILGVAVMLAAEYRPRALLGGAVAFWIGIGWIGVGAYALGLLDVGSRPALTAVIAVGIVATIAAAVLASRRRSAPEEPSGSGTTTPGWGRAVLPTLIGLTGGLLAVRASIEPVTQWDAVVTNLSFARDWLQSLPGLPHAAGPSAGAEVSYNQPALFPAVAVAVAAPLHLDVADVARLVSPLAAVTLLAALRLIGSRSGLAAWAPSMFLLGSTLFVAYGQWPTAYMFVLVLLTLAVALLATDRRLSLPAAALIGLSAGAALVGIFLAAIVLGVYVGCRASRNRPTASGRGVGLVALLVGPLAIVVAASLDRTRSLLFPWLTWPGGGHLLPQPEWAAAEHVLVANRYGHPNVDLGDYLSAVRGIATSSALAPGSLLAACAVVAACAVAIAAGRRTVRVAAGAVLVAALLLVALQLVRLGDFLPVTIALAVAIGAVMGALAVERGPIRLNAVARSIAVVGVAVCLASGAAYAVAGPNDRTSTASTNYRGSHVSAFERARAAADPGKRLDVVFGGDARAWNDIETLSARGLAVGTFDVRSYYAPYRPVRQLDGRAGASIGGNSGPGVARQLNDRGIDAVFVPSVFWEPGPARNPLADLSPVALWVGAPSLRAVRVYLPDQNVTYPSVLYGVGAAGVRRIASLLRTPAFSVAGPPSSRTAALPGGFAFEGTLGNGRHWRVAAPVTEGRGPALRFTTSDVDAAPDVSIRESRKPSLFTPASFVDCARVPVWARRSTLDVRVPGSPLGFAALDVTSRPGAAGSFGGEIVGTTGPVLVRACGDPTGDRGGVFPAGSPSDRIAVDLDDAGTRPILAFDYRDDGDAPVSFTARDEFRMPWKQGVPTLERCGSGRWLHARLPLPRATVLHGRMEIGPVVTGRNLTIRNLALATSGPSAIPRCPGAR